jgi:hypothetical protein
MSTAVKVQQEQGIYSSLGFVNFRDGPSAQMAYECGTDHFEGIRYTAASVNRCFMFECGTGASGTQQHLFTAASI